MSGTPPPIGAVPPLLDASALNQGMIAPMNVLVQPDQTPAPVAFRFLNSLWSGEQQIWAQVVSFQSTLESILGSVLTLETQMATIINDVATIGGQVNTLMTQMATVITDLGNMQAQINDILRRINAAPGVPP